MNKRFCLFIFLFICSFCVAQNNTFRAKLLSDKRYNSGVIYGTKEIVPPKIYQFDNYTLVSGFPNDSGGSSLGVYYNTKEIYYTSDPESWCDTIMKATLNNDGVPDFLFIYVYDGGVSLTSLVSNSRTSFSQKILSSEIYTKMCFERGDTLNHVLPIQIKDLNNDGADDVIISLVRMNNKTFAISCTDTVLSKLEK